MAPQALTRTSPNQIDLMAIEPPTLNTRLIRTLVPGITRRIKTTTNSTETITTPNKRPTPIITLTNTRLLTRNKGTTRITGRTAIITATKGTTVINSMDRIRPPQNSLPTHRQGITTLNSTPRTIPPLPPINSIRIVQFRLSRTIQRDMIKVDLNIERRFQIPRDIPSIMPKTRLRDTRTINLKGHMAIKTNLIPPHIQAVARTTQIPLLRITIMAIKAIQIIPTPIHKQTCLVNLKEVAFPIQLL